MATSQPPPPPRARNADFPIYLDNHPSLSRFLTFVLICSIALGALVAIMAVSIIMLHWGVAMIGLGSTVTISDAIIMYAITVGVATLIGVLFGAVIAVPLAAIDTLIVWLRSRQVTAGPKQSPRD